MDYSEIYALFTDVTPLAEDCGSVCGGACCRCGGALPENREASADSAALGMRLFPGEACGLGEADGAAVVASADSGRLLLCGGRCHRERRPLACRLFPLFPYVTEEGAVKAAYDPRAYRVCPLIRLRERVPLRRDFVRAVRRAGRMLMRDTDCRAFLQAQSREIDEFNAFLRLNAGRSPICRRKIK